MILRCLILSLIFIFFLYSVPLVKGITEKEHSGIDSKLTSQNRTCIDSCKGFFDYVPEKTTTSFELLFQRKLFKIRTNLWRDFQIKSLKVSPACFQSAISYSSPYHYNLIIPVAFRKLLIWFRLRFPNLLLYIKQFILIN